MERKLELKDIAGYLPYGLMVKRIGRNKKTVTSIVVCDSLSIEDEAISLVVMCKRNLEGYTPILRPMSDLVKPMVHPDINDGEEFVPIYKLIETAFSDIYTIKLKGSIKNGIKVYLNGCNGAADYYTYLPPIISRCETCTLAELNILHQLHFDYNDLIGKGLAIDINTIK